MILQIQSVRALDYLKGVVRDILGENGGFVLTEKHKQILDERFEKYDSGRGELFSWEEIRGRLEKK